MDKIKDILTRGVENVIPNKESLEKLLNSDKKLNVYYGIDPTATRIHIGHAVPLRKLQALADLGHNVTFLIGDFTALIGDTSDKDSERPVLTYEQIQENFQTYKKQAEKVLDFSKVTVKHNSEWLQTLTFTDVVKLCQQFSVGDFTSRELIRKRMAAGTRVGLHEFLYPVMQGYDHYFMDADLQIGGTDQTFNMQAGRTLQKVLRNKETFVLATGFLEGTDGRKMSKSWGNAIWLDDEPKDMYGKIMSVADEVLINYFTLGTNISLEEIEEKKKRLENGESPMVLKKELAYQIVKELHSQDEAKNAQEAFENTFQKGQINIDELPEFGVTAETNIVDILVMANAASSKSEAKRLVEQNAVEVNGEVIADIKYTLVPKAETVLVKVGKKTFFKLVAKS